MKIISFSVWGTDPTYTIGAIKNAKLAKEFTFYVFYDKIITSPRTSLVLLPIK